MVLVVVEREMRESCLVKLGLHRRIPKSLDSNEEMGDGGGGGDGVVMV